MNPDTGEDAEDWFAKFEREARESAAKRDGETDAGGASNGATGGCSHGAIG